MNNKLYEIKKLRQKIGVFRNRRYAGQLLADMLHEWKNHSKAMVLAVPSGGIPVAIEVAGALNLSFNVQTIQY